MQIETMVVMLGKLGLSPAVVTALVLLLVAAWVVCAMLRAAAGVVRAAHGVPQEQKEKKRGRRR